MSDSFLGAFPSLSGPGADIPSDEASLDSLFATLSAPKKPTEFTPLPQLNPAARTGDLLDSENPPPVETPPVPQQRPRSPAAPPPAGPQPQAKSGFRDIADIFGTLNPAAPKPPESVQTKPAQPAQPAATSESLADMFPTLQPKASPPKSILDRQAQTSDPSSLLGPDLGDVNVAREQAQKAKQDPGLRQELLKKINTPYQPPDMRPINPLTDFSNWWQRYKANVNEPVREAWEDQSWFRPAHLALSYVTYPFNVLTSAVTTTAGFEKAPMITDAFSQYAAAHNFSNVGGYLAIMAGMGLDVLSDPFNLVTSGAKAEFKVAQEYLNRAPSLAFIGDADRALELGRRTKQSRYATPEAIEKIAAPQAALDNVRAAIGPDAERSDLFAQIADFTHGSGAPQYRKFVEQAKREKDLEEFAQLPETFAAPLSADPQQRALDFQSKMWDLARHEVQFTRNAIEGAPVLRVLGKPLGLNGYRVPSPWVIFEDLASKAAGAWQKFRLPTTPVADQLVPDAAVRVRGWVESTLGRRLTDEQWANFATHDAEAFLQQSQIGIRQRPGAGFKPLAENIQSQPGLLYKPGAVNSWAYAYLKNVDNPANQQAVLQNMIDLYDVMISSIRQEPKAAWTATADQLQQGRNALQKIVDDGVEQFVERRNQKYYATQKVAGVDASGNPVMNTVLRKDANGALIPRTVTKERVNEFGEAFKVAVAKEPPQPPTFYVNRMQDTMQQLESAFAELSGPGGLVDRLQSSAASTPREFSDMLADTISAQRRDIPSLPVNRAESIVSMIDRIQKDHDLLTRSARSYPYDVFDAMSRRDVGAAMDRVQEIGNTVKMFTDDVFLNAERSVTGAEVLGKMLNSNGGKRMVESWWQQQAANYGASGLSRYNRFEDPVTGAVISYTDLTKLTPTEVSAARAQITQDLQRLLDNKQIDATLANEFENFVNQVGDDGLGQFLYGMANLAQTKLKTNVRARVMSAMAAPYKAALEKAEAMIRTTHADDLRQIFNMYGRYQDHFTPNQMFEWVYRPGGIMDRIDTLYEKVFRTQKFGPRVFESLTTNESKKLQADLKAEDYARDFSENHVLRAAASVDPKFAANRVTGEAEQALNEAYGQIMSCRQSLRYESPAWDDTIGKINGMTWSEYVRQKAAKEVDEGYKRLNELFGVTDGSRTKADAFLSRVNHEAKYREIYASDSRAGRVGLGRADYINYKLIGNGHDYDNWLDYLKEIEDSATEGRALAVKTYGHGETRRFLDVAEVMAYMDKINIERQAAGKLPLNLQPVYNISALLGERYHNHLTGIINRNTLYEMATLLPDHVRMFTFKPKSGKWRDVGDLIPSMRGQGMFIDNRLYDYLGTFVPQVNREKGLWDSFATFNQYITRLSTNFSLVHLKNQIALATLARMDPQRFGKWVRYMWENRNLSRRANQFSPIEQMRHAIESHPLYKEAVENGLTHFRGDAAFRSTAENVIEQMNPTIKWWERWTGYRKGKGMTGSPQGPFSGFVFDVVDRGMKMALYEDYRMRGLTPRKAAELVNLYMIDYSARMLNPNVKRIGYAMFPFFSWHVGNALLHIPNILQNPQMYSLIRTAERFMNRAYSPYSGFPPDQVPALLANAVATPFTDRNGYQNWVMPDIPGQAHLNLMTNIMKNPLNPFHITNETARFVLTRSRVGNILYNAMNPYERQRLSNEDIFSYMFGDADRPGYVDETLWGLMPMREFVKLGVEATTNPVAWDDMKYIALNMFMRTEPVGPDGKAKHREQWKTILSNKLGIGE